VYVLFVIGVLQPDEVIRVHLDIGANVAKIHRFVVIAEVWRKVRW
jgi:hypothetical protein